MAEDGSRSDSVSALAKAEQSGLSFLPTPGPGDSEGGEIYAPAIKNCSNSEQAPAPKQ
jgi:hypothetical protein